LDSLGDCFDGLDDPRGPHARRYDLPEILTIALCAVLAGAQTAVDMAVFAEAKQDFLRSFLRLENGVPSHHTFARVFRHLDPDQFRTCFQKFMSRFSGTCTGVVAIDGKTVHRPANPARPGPTLHMISAWCCDTRLVLAQIATTAKLKESAAVIKLLETLRLSGRIVTADAFNCNPHIGQRILDQGGDYVLALKSNNSALHADVMRFFADPKHQKAQGCTTHDRDHGRVETRIGLVSTDIDRLQERHHWPGLRALGRVIRIRQTGSPTASQKSTETGYYLISTALSAERLGQVVRAHWGVENRLHWILNVVMNEGQVRSRRYNSPYNLAILRHMALNLMHKDRSKVSLRSKFNRAAWRDDFLAKLLAQA